MLFRQLFDAESFTYTYLIASRPGREALIIDSVHEHTGKYLRLLEELDLKLVKVVDTHTRMPITSPLWARFGIGLIA